MTTPQFDDQDIVVFYGADRDDPLHQAVLDLGSVYRCYHNNTHAPGTVKKWPDPPNFTEFQQHVRELRDGLAVDGDEEESLERRIASVPEEQHLENLRAALAAEIERVDQQLAGLRSDGGGTGPA